MSGLRPWPIIRLLLRRSTSRHWRSAPRATALQVLILAIGIAVFFSVRLASRAAVSSFQVFTGLVSQEADWQVSATVGDLPDSVLRGLRDQLGDEPVEIVPVVEATAARPRGQKDERIFERETYHLVGIDLVAVQNLASSAEGGPGWSDQRTAATDHFGSDTVWNLLRNGNAVLIPPAMAKRSSLKVGDTFRVVIDEDVVALQVAGLIPASPSRPEPPDNLLILDLPALQRLAHRDGRLTRIDFFVPDGPAVDARRRALRERLAAIGKDRWQVSSPDDRRASAAAMTGAFRMNLTILSLVSLLVGLYLIFQSLDGAVVRRREEIGVLRSLGVTEKIVRRLFLLEAALLGLVGGPLGALLGWGGAQIAVRYVGRTVNALYYATTVRSARFDPGEFLIAIGLAVTASLLAGWWPARQAARVPPAQILSRDIDVQERGSILDSAAFAWLLLATSAMLILLPPLRLSGALRLPLGGYAAALGLILGGGMLCGRVLRTLARMLRFTGRYSLSAKMATSHLANASSRHRLAVAGLLCAVTMAAAMMILVASFETTMRDWINTTFQADLYLTSGGAQSASMQNRIPPATWRAIVTNAAVADVNVIQSSEINIDDISTMLVGADLRFSERHAGFIWRQAPLDRSVFLRSESASLGLVSESFAERFRVRRGDMVRFPTPDGEKRISIAGVFSDYGNERGSLFVDRIHFAAWFGHEMATSMVIVAQNDVAPEKLQGGLTAQFPGLTIVTNSYLRTEILRIFRQTFSVTYALEIIGVIVAVIGLGMTLSSILLDRRTELTTLRALGWRRREIAQATAVEGSLLSFCGVAGGTVVGLGLGWIVIFVINKQSFGWTLQFAVPWFSLGALGLLVVAAGTVVAYLVGRRGSGLAADREG